MESGNRGNGRLNRIYLSRPPPSRPPDIKISRRRCIVVVLVHASHVAIASAALNPPDHVTLPACLLAGNRQPLESQQAASS